MFKKFNSSHLKELKIKSIAGRALTLKMKYLIALSILTVMACLATAADTSNLGVNNRVQFKPGEFYNEQYNRRYYKNREIYNRHRYYDNFYKKYNPDVAPQEARIVEQSVEPIQKDGTFGYSYETENGIHNEAHGTPITLDNGDKAQKVEGAFSFVTPEGIRVGIRYVADESGYRPIITYDGFNAEHLTRSQAAANVEITNNY